MGLGAFLKYIDSTLFESRNLHHWVTMRSPIIEGGGEVGFEEEGEGEGEDDGDEHQARQD